MKRLVGMTLLAAAAAAPCLMTAGCAREPVRMGMVVGIKPDKIEYYKELHANAWPEILKKIEDCHIRNYVIYLGEVRKGKWYLFSHFEYVGEDMAADFAKMGADPMTRKWWKETDPCQIPLPTRKKPRKDKDGKVIEEGEKIWHVMEEVFYHP